MKSHHLLFAGTVSALLVAGAIYLYASDERGPGHGDMAGLARGQAVYGQYCASCHGADMKGQPNWRARGPDGRLPAPPHDETGHTWHHPDAMLFAVVKQGTEAVAPPGYKSDMPGFGDVLSDDEIRDVLAYIRSRWPQEIRDRQAAISGRTDG